MKKFMEQKDLNLFVAEFLHIRFENRDGEITRDSPLVLFRNLFALAKDQLSGLLLFILRSQEDDLNVRFLQFLQLRHHLDQFITDFRVFL